MGFYHSWFRCYSRKVPQSITECMHIKPIKTCVDIVILATIAKKYRALKKAEGLEPNHQKRNLGNLGYFGSSVSSLRTFTKFKLATLISTQVPASCKKSFVIFNNIQYRSMQFVIT